MNKKKSSYIVFASRVLMGAGQLLAKQWIKGLLYLSLFGAYLVYMISTGVKDLIGFFTLGTVKGDAWLGIQGDDSIIMLLRGILMFLLTGLFVMVHLSNVRDAKTIAKKMNDGIDNPSFWKAVKICSKTSKSTIT